MRHYGITVAENLQYRLRKIAAKNGEGFAELVKRILREYVEEKEKAERKKNKKEWN